VAFTDWTPYDKLRHPRLLGLRPDKAAQEVVRERP
jgi:ATP-dependent DNA ligase